MAMDWDWLVSDVRCRDEGFSFFPIKIDTLWATVKETMSYSCRATSSWGQKKVYWGDILLCKAVHLIGMQMYHLNLQWFVCINDLKTLGAPQPSNDFFFRMRMSQRHNPAHL